MTVPPNAPVAETVPVVFRFLRSSRLFMSADEDDIRPPLAQNQLREWLNPVKCAFNEIPRSNNISHTPQEEEAFSRMLAVERVADYQSNTQLLAKRTEKVCRRVEY